jgi:UDP-glucuronate 4-epimerase
MKILVTGCAGFIGSNLIDLLLLKGYNVVGIDNFDEYYPRENKNENLKEALKSANFKFFELDILNKESLGKLVDNYDAIIHLAAKAGVRPSLENPNLYQKVNVEGTQNIVDFAMMCNNPKIIFASSSSVYGINKSQPWKEDDLNLLPISPYAVSKIAGEWIGKYYVNVTGSKFFALRFFTVYGPRQRPDLAINSFTNKIINDQVITLYGDGSTYRDYTYIDDITFAIFKLIINESILGHQIYNLGSNNPIKLNDMVKTIETVLKKKAKIKYENIMKGDVPSTYANIDKANIDFEFIPKIIFQNGLVKYFQFLKESKVGFK